MAISFLIFLFSCKRNKTEYTIKGYMFVGENKTPVRNEEFDVQVFGKGTGKFSNKIAAIETIGKAKSDNNGYIEFTYTHLRIRRATDIRFTQDLSGLYKGNEFAVPINRNITKEFYRPPHGWVDIFLNTNNKLTNEDTFFIKHFKFFHTPTSYDVDTELGTLRDFLNPSKYLIQSFRFGQV
jgi:hypothetical protein